MSMHGHVCVHMNTTKDCSDMHQCLTVDIMLSKGG